MTLGEKVEKNILILTSDTMGPVKNGGVGTACFSLAMALAADGHKVTVCFAPIHESHLNHFSNWQQFYLNRKIRLIALPLTPFPIEFFGMSATSYAAYQFVKKTHSDLPWDVIHFPDMHGLGFFTLAAKRTLGEFSTSQICVTLHGPTSWAKCHNKEREMLLDDLELDFLESKSIEMADTLFAPTHAALEIAKSLGMKIPSHTIVVPNIVGTCDSPPQFKTHTKIETLAFFGRLETRKGLELFVEALLHIGEETLKGLPILFLGKVGLAGDTDAKSYIEHKLAGFDYSLLSDMTSTEALHHLNQTSPLVVIPSVSETMGYTLCEVLELGLPVLATRIPSFVELLEENSEVLAEPNALDLSAKILTAMRKSTPPKGKRKISNTEVIERHLDWHRKCLSALANTNPTPTHNYPLVSVCVPHKDRPKLLKECIESIYKQTYPNIEILIGDDASTTSDAIEYLNYLSSHDNPISVRIIRASQRQGPGTVRNNLSALAAGDFILFMDDDNIATPTEVETFVNAQARTGADILTCAFERLENNNSDQLNKSQWVPLGPAINLGYFLNAFGDMNAFVKKTTYRSLNGLNCTPLLGGEDWEFFARAAMNGYKIEVVPRPLFLYRQHADQYSKSVDPEISLAIRATTYAQNLSLQDLSNLLLTVTKIKTKSLQPSLYNLRARNPHLERLVDPHDHRRHFPKLLYSAKPDSFAANVVCNKDARLEISSHKLQVDSLGLDPILILLEPEIPSDKETSIEVEMECSRASKFTLYFKTLENNRYTESQTMSCGLKKGTNAFSFKLQRGATGNIRIDPSDLPGKFAIRSLEIYCEL
jgi:glycosyltransferase involved in cell wall biosynthesis